MRELEETVVVAVVVAVVVVVVVVEKAVGDPPEKMTDGKLEASSTPASESESDDSETAMGEERDPEL